MNEKVGLKLKRNKLDQGATHKNVGDLRSYMSGSTQGVKRAFLRMNMRSRSWWTKCGVIVVDMKGQEPREARELTRTVRTALARGFDDQLIIIEQSEFTQRDGSGMGDDSSWFHLDSTW